MSLVNAFGAVSTEATLSEILSKINNMSSSNGDAHLVSGTKVRYRREFTDPTLEAFNVVTGPGMSVTAGSGTLSITTGTTAGSVTTLMTKQTFTAPSKVAFGFKISQKITNQEFYLELVAVDDNGVIDEERMAAWRIAGTDSTTTTVARVETRNGPPVRSQSGNITTISQTTDGIYEIVIESDEVQFHTRSIDSTVSRTGSTTRNSVAPDPNLKYAMRIRIVNGSTAPASTTTMTSQFVTAIDYTEIQTEITGGPGTSNPSSSMPVTITGGGVTMANGTIGASTSTTGSGVAKVNSTATTNATLVKSTAGRVYGYHLANTHATAWRYVKLYNSATTPVPGTTAVVYVIPLAPNSSVTAEMTIPISHATGIGYSIVSGPVDTDATAVGANEVIGHFLWV